jgi:23S rRNA pseudouridine1911/1915/1917 synthase
MPLWTGGVNLDGESSLRLDRYIAEKLKLLSRSQIKVRNLSAAVNEKKAKISFPVKTGDRLELNWEEENTTDLTPENIPLDILYEDGRVIVINKAQGMVVHPACGNWNGTLANALLWHLRQSGLRGTAYPPPGALRPFIVHRLDKDTSGLIIATFNLEAQTFLQNQFKARHVSKTYIALTRGAPRDERGLIKNYITRDKKTRKYFTVSDDKGKYAITRWRVLKTFMLAGSSYSLIKLKPATGRTHQLRVHLKHLGCPVLGDPLYGDKDKNFPRATLMLHAARLKIQLPGDTEKTIFRCPLPPRFKPFISATGTRHPRCLLVQ